MCGPSEVAVTRHHTVIVNYIHADLQFRVIVAFSTKRKRRVDPGPGLLFPSFALLHFFMMIISTIARNTCACAYDTTGTQENKQANQKLESVSSTVPLKSKLPPSCETLIASRATGIA